MTDDPQPPDRTSSTEPETNQEFELDRLFTWKRQSEITLDDIHGLNEDVQKLRETVIPSLASSATPVRMQTVLFEGIDGASPDRLASATAGTLAEKGFGVLEAQQPQARRDRRNIWRALGSVLPQHEPVVVDIPPNVVERTDSTAAKDHLQAVTDTNDRIAVLCSYTYEEAAARRRHSPLITDAAELRVEVARPDVDRRLALFQTELKAATDQYGIDHQLNAGELKRVAQNADGFTHDDCRAAVKRAAVLATNTDGNNTCITQAVLSTAVDQRQAERVITDEGRPRGSDIAARYQPSIPDITFEGVGGLDDVIDRFERLLVMHDQRGVFDEVDLIPGRGVMLYGPPGTGKTRLAKAAANEFQRSFFAIEGAAIKNKWFGESERTLRRIFIAAEEEAPSLLFLDELDALAPRRDAVDHSAVRSMVTTLLAELDGFESRGDIIVVGATNRRDAIDPAVLRPGRLGTHLEVPAPDTAGQESIFEIHTQDVPTEGDVTPEWFASVTPAGMTGADIAAVVGEALFRAIAPPTGSRGSEDPMVSRENIRESLAVVINEQSSSGRGFA